MDTWSLDNILCERLGEQLLHLAKTIHGWPDGEFATYDDWQAVLRENGTALIEYVTQPGTHEALMKWHDLKFGEREDSENVLNEPDTPEVREAFVTLNTIESRYDYEAEKALHWVADRLGHLWD